jgi:hypothetical protein
MACAITGMVLCPFTCGISCGVLYCMVENWNNACKKAVADATPANAGFTTRIELIQTGSRHGARWQDVSGFQCTTSGAPMGYSVVITVASPIEVWPLAAPPAGVHTGNPQQDLQNLLNNNMTAPGMAAPVATPIVATAVAAPAPAAQPKGRFDPMTGAENPKFDPQTGVQNW